MDNRTTRMVEPQQRPDPAVLMSLSFSFANQQILRTAVELDLFTHIENGAHTAADLAKASGATERGVRMLADALVGLKVLEKAGNRYSLTDAARTFLTKNSPAYMGAWILHSDQIKEAWSHLTESVRTGHPWRKVETEEGGATFFAQFVDSLFVMNVPGATAAAKHVVNGRRGLKVLDIGAGSGVWSLMVAKEDPDAHVTVADFPQVIEVTKRFVAKHGFTDRYDYLPGDFRQSDFGRDKYDIATLGHICHSEGPRQSEELLRRIKRALKPGGQLVIGEFLADEERKENAFALMFALNMLVHTEEGDTFTLTELKDILTRAGFDAVDTLQAPAPSPLIIARTAAAKAGEKAA